MEDRFLVLSRECCEAYSDEEEPSDCRLLLSRFNTPHMSSFEIEVFGHNLFLSQDPNSKHLGTTVWDSSLVFAKFMERSSKKGEFSRAKMRGKRVIELGAGCGLAGLGMALLGCDVVVTDQVAVLPILLRNVERNLARAKYAASDNPYLEVCIAGMKKFTSLEEDFSDCISKVGSIGNVEVAELDWGNEAHIAAVEPPFDYIIGTDVVYVEHLLEPLINTILALAGPKTTVMLGYEFRSSGVREQLNELCKKHFLVKKVLHAKMHPEYQHPNIDLFILRRIDTSTSIISMRPAEGHCRQGELETLQTGESTASRESSAELSSVSSDNEEDRHGVTCQTQGDGHTQAGSADELSSDDESLSGTGGPNIQQNGTTPLVFSSTCNSTHEKSRSQPSDWEIRRLGSSVARLLSEVSLPSA